MITEQQVYDQFDKALSLAKRFNVHGYESHDLASEAVLHLLNRSKQANFQCTAIKDFAHWATRVMRRKIMDIRRGTLAGPLSPTVMQRPRFVTEGAGAKDNGFTHDGQTAERNAFYDSAIDNHPHYANQASKGNGYSKVHNAPSREANPLTALTDAEEKAALPEAIRSLAGPYRKTADLMLGGVSDEDGATILGTTLAAYQMRKSRVIAKLREIMVKD